MSVLTTFYRFLLRGGPTEKVSVEVAKDRELLLDTTTKELRVGDGATPGGLPLTVGTPTADRHLANKAYVDAGLAGRALSAHQHARADLPWINDPGAVLLTASSASAQRSALGLTPWAVRPWTDGTTSDVPEGAQLYFTVDRANTCADARIAAQKGQAGGLATLNAHGELDSTQVPAISVVDFLGQVASEAAMLALDGEKGDWCTRTDLGTDWQIIGNDPTQAASWRQSMYPASPVQSVHGRNGAVWGQVGDYDMFYLLKTAQAADSAKLGGQLPGYFAPASHTHNYAGSSAAGGAATTALECTGNSATATALAMARLINGTSFNGSSDVIVSKIYDADYIRIANPDGGTLLSYGTETGAIAIRLPNGFSNTMVSFSGVVYNYVSNKSFTFSVHGYCYENGSWFSTSAQVSGFPEANLGVTVRFGRLADLSPVVYIGDLDSTWTYPQVSVNNVFCTWDGFSSAWTTGWQVTFESNAFMNVSAAATNCQVGYRPANAFTGAKVIGGTALNFVNGLLVE